MEPEFFGESGTRAEPGFEIAVGSLPVGPAGTRRFDGASFGAEIINVEWL